MSHPVLDAESLAALQALDTPTVCNALEVVCPERRGHGYTEETFVAVDSGLPPMVGYAATSTIRSIRPGTRDKSGMRQQRIDYYRYVYETPGPTISVVQDLDGGRAGFGSFWGEVNSAVHKALGCSGAITDGSMRDLDDIAPNFQILARKVVPSHAFVHMEDFGVPVSVCGMNVRAGDLIHADQHGAVVIPHDHARSIAEAAAGVAAKEKIVLDVVRAETFDFDEFIAAYGEMTK